jgi:hypothetical protein
VTASYHGSTIGPTTRGTSTDERPSAFWLHQEGLHELLTTLRTGPGALRALAFSLEQVLIGGGWSPSASLRAWHRRIEWDRERKTRGLAHAIAGIVKSPARIARDRWRAVQIHGPTFRETHGVSRAAQYRQLVWLGLRWGLDSDSYYRFWLFQAARRRRAGAYLPTHHAAALYRVLALREASEDVDILEDKLRFAEWCAAHGIPTIPILAHFRDGEAQAYGGAEHGIPDRDLFSKPTSEYGGAGARVWRYQGPDRWTDDADGSRYDREGLVGALVEQSRTHPVILQACLVNHDALHPVSARALCTLRLLTGRAPGEAPELIAAAFRTGAGRSASDNFSGGGIAISVDLKTGRLRDGVRLDEQRYVRAIDTHPDTGVRFEGLVLPSWREARALALAAHASLPSIALVGWDIAFTPDGLVLLEGNFNPGVRILQAGSGIPLGETRFCRILDAHLRRSFSRGVPAPSLR